MLLDISSVSRRVKLREFESKTPEEVVFYIKYHAPSIDDDSLEDIYVGIKSIDVSYYISQKNI